MREDRSWTWAEPLIGADRDATALCDALLGGTSLIVAGTRGSGRSHLLRAVVGELAQQAVAPVVIRPSTVLSDVPFGALDAAGDSRIADLRRGRGAEEGIVVVVDDVHTLDVDSAGLLLRAVADGRVTLLASLLIPRARARRLDLDRAGVGQAVLSLWLDGLAERVDLTELTPSDSERLLAVLPGASTLDAVICGALLWRADGSRTLLRELVAEAVTAVAHGRDPFAAVRDTPPHSRLSVALTLHTADLAEEDQECLAFLYRLPHLAFSVATRFLSTDRLEAMITAGLLHAEDSPARRLTANEALAREAERQLDSAHIARRVDDAGLRMLSDGGEWWSTPLAVSIAERWHRGDDVAGEGGAITPALRARVALDAARDANDRGDAAHAAAHAARGLRAVDSADLRLEAAYALTMLGTEGESISLDEIDRDALGEEGRGRLVRMRAVIEDRGLVVPLSASTRGDADAEIEGHLERSARAGSALEWSLAHDEAERALARATERTATSMRALLATGLAEAFRGRWSRTRLHFEEVERLLDARQRASSIGAAERVGALLVMLATSQLAGADGGALHARLIAERTTAAREHVTPALTLAGVATSIVEVNLGRPDRALREWEAVRRRSAGSLPGPDADLAELRLAESLAEGGRVSEARAMLSRTEPADQPLLRHARIAVETTVLMAEGRLDEARLVARDTAELSRERDAPALRLRDLFRLFVLEAATDTEEEELRALVREVDLPLAAELDRRLAEWDAGEVSDASERLRLEALWSFEGDSEDSHLARLSRLPVHADAPGASALRELTRREREIALLVDEGHTNREVAARLYLSVRTVESHVYQARAKIGASSRAELGRMVAQWERHPSRA